MDSDSASLEQIPKSSMSQLFIPSSPGNSDGDQSQRSQSHEYSDPFSERPPSTPEFSFAAATSQVSHLADVLASISAIHTYALMVISPYGITFFSEYNHIMNAQVSVDASLFSAFEYHWTNTESLGSDGSPPKNVQLGINVHMLNDAFAAAAATVVPRGKTANNGNSGAVSDTVLCYLKYRGDGHALVVEFEDRLMSEQIEFATFHLDIEFPYGDENPESQTRGSNEQAALLIDHSALRLEVILQSDILANLLQDLQNLGTEDLYIIVSNKTSAQGTIQAASHQSNSVDFISKGAIGYSKLVYPKARTMLQKLEIYEEGDTDLRTVSDSVLSTVGFSSFIKIFRAVKLSSKCKIMKDFSGVFSIQLLCKNTAAKNYPGTLIAFNMLEKSELGGTGQVVEVDVGSLFDDQVYQEVREYDQENSKQSGGSGNAESTENQGHLGNSGTETRSTFSGPDLSADHEPFSFETFRRKPSGGQQNTKRSRLGEDNASTATFESETPDLPVFL